MFWLAILPATGVAFFWLSLQEERSCRIYREERYKWWRREI
jgi:hypothetical protein